MSITIRLAKFGKKHAPAYKMVVANTKDKRNGKFLDILGHYNPSENPVKFEYDKEKYNKWKGNGALVTKAVEQLVEGTYEQKEFDPHKELAKKQANKKKEEVKEEPKEEVKEEETKEESTEEEVKETEEEK